MLILGISGGFRQGYQDASACLVEDGKVLAAIEEERLSRIKHSPGKLPFRAISEVLNMSGRSIQDVDEIAFHGSTWGDHIDEKLKDYFQNYFGCVPTIRRHHHHDCHAASTFFASKFDEALIITSDSSGDGVSLQVSVGRDNKIKCLKRYDRPNSLGIFYSLITQYCGYTKESDEYKLMGLSSYGNREGHDLSFLIDFNNGELSINQKFLISIPPRTPSPHKDEMLFSKAFVAKMGKPRRLPGKPIDQFYKDVAASAQQHLEDVMLKVLEHYMQKTSLSKLCLAGGVALNCVQNQKLMESGLVEQLYVKAAAGDSGISIGAAWLSTMQNGLEPKALSSIYLGPSFSNVEIERTLKTCGIEYSWVKDPSMAAAELIANDKVIGWFQGRMEFGPRALGNRSILANPCNPRMKEIINGKIKFRESYRPFCPSVLEEDVGHYFKSFKQVSPFMNITFEVKPGIADEIPAVVHVDGTARVQTVNRGQNALFYELLQELKRLTGHGLVLNTSFNLSHEPIVCTPRQALSSFYSSGLDALVIGNFLVTKDFS